MNDDQHQAMLDLYAANMTPVPAIFEGIGSKQWTLATPATSGWCETMPGTPRGMLMFGILAGGGALPD